ncbi:MAG: GNAT family N-acetyltransferase, partial [Prevotella sp.]|nr:GNAT family N-acetyltransferase [Prevotella sp.]
MLAVSYVFWEKETKQTVAFFSLANDKVSLSDFDNKTEFNRFRKKRFVNEKRLRSYPAVKICRLGVDESLKGMSIGTILLKFIKTFFVKDNKTGCRFITVDAYSNAISFYERNGFIPLNDDDKDERTRLLYFDLYDVMDE